MIVNEKVPTENVDVKEWENPLNPEGPKDARDKQQAQRLYEEAARLKANLTKEDETGKQKD